MRCQLCDRPGYRFCPDAIGCYFRARRRLGLPERVCEAWRRRDELRLA